jgi:ATP-dependent helicase HrpA
VAKDFELIVAQARAKTSLLAQEWARRVQAIVTEAAATYKKLGTIKAHPAALVALQAQYERLFHKAFLDEAFERLGHYPRYLQAMALRCDKLRTDPARDTRLMSELSPLWTQYTRAKAARKGQVDDTLDSIRWLLEELHVGLFAQELKTPTPVSVKRVSKAFEGLER